MVATPCIAEAKTVPVTVLMQVKNNESYGHSFLAQSRFMVENYSAENYAHTNKKEGHIGQHHHAAYNWLRGGYSCG